MALELALVQPPNMYDVSPPATYEEARQVLYSTGQILLDVIDSQPPQQTFAQTLTAQTLKELGRGWTSIFSVMPADPISAAPGNARFQWSPGDSLVIAFPEGDPGQQVCSAVEGFYRSATWREVMEEGSGLQLEELLGEFEMHYQQNLEAGAGPWMVEVLSELVTELYAKLFRFEDTQGPLLSNLEIRWGGADGCLEPLANEYRASRR